VRMVLVLLSLFAYLCLGGAAWAAEPAWHDLPNGERAYGYWYSEKVFVVVSEATGKPVKALYQKPGTWVKEKRPVFDGYEEIVAPDYSDPRELYPVQVFPRPRYAGDSLDEMVLTYTDYIYDDGRTVRNYSSNSRKLHYPYGSRFLEPWRWFVVPLYNPNDWPVEARVRALIEGDRYEGTVLFAAGEEKHLLLKILEGADAQKYSTDLVVETRIVKNLDPDAPPEYVDIDAEDAPWFAVCYQEVEFGPPEWYEGSERRQKVFELVPCFKRVPRWVAESGDARWGELAYDLVPGYAWQSKKVYTPSLVTGDGSAVPAEPEDVALGAAVGPGYVVKAYEFAENTPPVAEVAVIAGQLPPPPVFPPEPRWGNFPDKASWRDAYWKWRAECDRVKREWERNQFAPAVEAEKQRFVAELQSQGFDEGTAAALFGEVGYRWSGNATVPVWKSYTPYGFSSGGDKAAFREGGVCRVYTPSRTRVSYCPDRGEVRDFLARYDNWRYEEDISSYDAARAITSGQWFAGRVKKKREPGVLVLLPPADLTWVKCDGSTLAAVGTTTKPVTYYSEVKERFVTKKMTVTVYRYRLVFRQSNPWPMLLAKPGVRYRNTRDSDKPWKEWSSFSDDYESDEKAGPFRIPPRGTVAVVGHCTSEAFLGNPPKELPSLGECIGWRVQLVAGDVTLYGPVAGVENYCDEDDWSREFQPAVRRTAVDAEWAEEMTADELRAFAAAQKDQQLKRNVLAVVAGMPENSTVFARVGEDKEAW